MEAFYIEIRHVHIAAALASGVLFLLRTCGVNLLAARWPMAAPLRYLSYTIDTVLLTAAMMLMVITQQFPGGTGWLTAKLLFILLYIALAWTGLRAARLRVRAASSVAAVMVFLFVVSVARAHDALGIFS